MAKSKEKLEARQLRRTGKSIKEIAQFLQVSVGGASLWCRDIILTSQQMENLRKRVTDPYYGKKADYLKRKAEEFSNKIAELKNQGIKEVGQLTNRDIFMIGIALYWGEGFKKDHQVGLATSDVNIANFFIRWLKEIFNISNKELILRLTANNSYKNIVHIMENYWAKELNIPIEQFSKPFFQHSIWKKEYENKNEYHGVIRIKVRKSVDLLRKIYGFIEGVSLITKSQVVGLKADEKNTF